MQIVVADPRRGAVMPHGRGCAKNDAETERHNEEG